MRIPSVLLAVFGFSHGLAGQTIEEVVNDLPPAYRVLTTWGVRPEFDETGENIYFLHRLIGDVFKVNLATREISAVTKDLHHGGIQRAHVLANGDLLLGIGNINTGDIGRDKEKLWMFVLKKDSPNVLHPLDRVFMEGLAVSKTSMKVAWTLPGQFAIKMGTIAYENGRPVMTDEQDVISFADSKDTIRLETQDFLPPRDEELLFTRYYGRVGDPYTHAQVYAYRFATKETIDYSKHPGSYNEVEGIFPDGKHIMIESDRHLPEALRHRYKVDIFRMKLDGSGEVEQLCDLAERFPELFRSDNAVVDPKGRYVAFQFGMLGTGARGNGIFLLDLQEYETWKAAKAGTAR